MPEARKLGFLYHAIVEGLRRPGLQAKLVEMGGRVGDVGLKSAAPAPTPVCLHPYLAELYRRKVRMLSETLADPQIRPRDRQVVPLACSGYGPP